MFISSKNDFLCYHVLDHPRLSSGILYSLTYLPMLAYVLGFHLLVVQLTVSLSIALVLLQGARCATPLIGNPELVTFIYAYFLCHNLYLLA